MLIENYSSKNLNGLPEVMVGPTISVSVVLITSSLWVDMVSPILPRLFSGAAPSLSALAAHMVSAGSAKTTLGAHLRRCFLAPVAPGITLLADAVPELGQIREQRLTLVKGALHRSRFPALPRLCAPPHGGPSRGLRRQGHREERGASWHPGDQTIEELL